MNYCISVVWHRGAQLVAAGVLLTAQVALITHLYFWVFLIFRLIMCNKGKGEGRGRSSGGKQLKQTKFMIINRNPLLWWCLLKQSKRYTIY